MRQTFTIREIAQVLQVNELQACRLLGLDPATTRPGDMVTRLDLFALYHRLEDPGQRQRLDDWLGQG